MEGKVCVAAGLFLLLLGIASVAESAPLDNPFLPSTDQASCVYTVYVRTGSIAKGGTDSNIGVKFYDSLENSILIDKLIEWGSLMPKGHDHYERGNLDIFSGKGDCLTTSICKMTVFSDGSGPHAGWYNNYIEVTSTGPHIECAQHLFTVEQWIASDAPPYSLRATRDDCT
ncbi:hypothetical protein O6H91_11G058900 [Diphasiastrum complanatum]|uniref:Uncharacterized protein n=1 Tax=Diphasiastrum complanatum TaxID=34168 RepID=A0ACC2C9J5_DIPCM|nr:hypothetical protein O6H91_11G058900 [Diphasiastrum complanatum]